MAPRGSASVSASVRVGPRGCPRQCGERSPCGFVWVRVSVCVGAGKGPRVGPRGSAWVCVSAGWVWDLGLRTSAWVHVGSRVNGRQCKPMRDLVRVRAGVGGKALFFFQVGCGTLASGQVTGPVKGCVHII